MLRRPPRSTRTDTRFPYTTLFRSSDPALKLYEVKGDRSGTLDDRWAFTSKSSALNYGSIAGLAEAARALKGFDDGLASKALGVETRARRSEERRGGTGWVSTCRARWSPSA